LSRLDRIRRLAYLVVMSNEFLFIIKGGDQVLLHPFVPGALAFDRLDEVAVEGRFGIAAEGLVAETLRSQLNDQAGRSLRRHQLGKGYYLRLFASAGIFMAVYLFFSIVVRDPLPFVDEFLLSSLAAVAFFLLIERRILAASAFHATSVRLRQLIDTIFFVESRVVSMVETWREEYIMLGGGSFYRDIGALRTDALGEADLPEAEALCRHFAARWRNVALVRAIYDAIKLGNPISGLLDRLTRRLGKAEAALVMSYMKLLYILENGPSRER